MLVRLARHAARKTITVLPHRVFYDVLIASDNDAHRHYPSHFRDSDVDACQ